MPVRTNIPRLASYRLLFVCMGNICRSPAAEAMMNHLTARLPESSRPVCDSAGTIGYHCGEQADARMIAAAARRGIPMPGTARQFTLADFDRFDLILTMDEQNHRDVLALAPDEASARKVVPMVSFCRSEPAPKAVPDPYYGGPQGFERVLDILEDACANLLIKLEES